MPLSLPPLEFSFPIAAMGMVIFFARIVDVSLGTLRTISIVQGRKWMAFGLGFFEVSLWLIVISAVIQRVQHTPVLGIFYALGFAAGNIVGIELEHWLALGHIILRVISLEHCHELVNCIRVNGFSVTVFHGEGKDGPVAELYIVCHRRELKPLLQLVHDIDPNAFYVTEQTAAVSKIYRPILRQSSSWRAIFKKK